MAKYNIPYDLILQNGETTLHNKVEDDEVFLKYYTELINLLENSISDVKLKAQILESSSKVYTFAEIKAYKEGFVEGIRFLIFNISHKDTDEISQDREHDFSDAFVKFISEYKMDRIADVYDFLEKDLEYKALQSSKAVKEKVLLESITDKEVSDLLMDYITTVDFMLDEFKTIFYEHGFQDCIAINKEMQKGLRQNPQISLN